MLQLYIATRYVRRVTFQFLYNLMSGFDGEAQGYPSHKLGIPKVQNNSNADIFLVINHL